MLNYNNRTIEPIISAIVDEMKRKFLTKTARSQHQSISFFRDPFKLVPVNEIAEIADKFTRNEIMTSNEIRQVVGMKPSDDPRADELRNKNLSEPSGSDQQSEEAPITTDNSVEESASDLDDKISKQNRKVRRKFKMSRPFRLRLVISAAGQPEMTLSVPMGE